MPLPRHDVPMMGEGDAVRHTPNDDDSVSEKGGSRALSASSTGIPPVQHTPVAIEADGVTIPTTTSSVSPQPPASATAHSRRSKAGKPGTRHRTPVASVSLLGHRGWNPEPPSVAEDAIELSYVERSKVILQTLRDEGILFGESSLRSRQHSTDNTTHTTRQLAASSATATATVAAADAATKQSRDPGNACRVQLPNVVESDRQADVRCQRLLAKMEENRQAVVEKYLARTEKPNLTARERKTQHPKPKRDESLKLPPAQSENHKRDESQTFKSNTRDV